MLSLALPSTLSLSFLWRASSAAEGYLQTVLLPGSPGSRCLPNILAVHAIYVRQSVDDVVKKYRVEIVG